jgi:hypothetical protein
MKRFTWNNTYSEKIFAILPIIAFDGGSTEEDKLTGKLTRIEPMLLVVHWLFFGFEFKILKND